MRRDEDGGEKQTGSGGCDGGCTGEDEVDAGNEVVEGRRELYSMVADERKELGDKEGLGSDATVGTSACRLRIVRVGGFRAKWECGLLGSRLFPLDRCET
jgi:hypothetical protein